MKAGRLARIEALSLRPASDLGREAVDELYRQTLGLLNFGEVPKDVFGCQIAFNVVPSMGVPQSRAEGFDERVREETRLILGLEAERVCLSSAFVPVFHGHALLLTLTFEEPIDYEVLREAIAKKKGLRLVQDQEEFSPVEMVGEENVAVLDLGPDAVHRRIARLWCFCDNLKGGAALNAVRIAERVTDLRRESLS